jgi:predicted PurR-regulated permease PerM
VPQVSVQVDELSTSLPKATDSLLGKIERYSWVKSLTRRTHDLGELLGRREALEQAGGVLSTTVGALGGFMVFLFVGLFGAFDPNPYRKGALYLLPPSRRDRVGQVLDEVVQILRQWMVGKFISMALVGTLTWIGLALLGIPLALTLTLLAALLTFVPNFGPILSAVPAILLAALQGPSKALYVALLYVGVQTVESYLVTPLVQKRTVSLPPALTIVAQVGMGMVAGGLGVVVATPLTAALLILVKRLYVEDVRGDSLSSEFEGSGDGPPRDLNPSNVR